MFFCRPLLVLLAAMLATAAVTRAVPAVTAAPGSHARVLPLSDDGFAGSSVNVVAGLQNTLFTAGGRQYAAFYAGDGTLVLGQRVLGDDTWTTQRTPHRGDVQDAHNTVAIAVDGDGYLHVAWNHHGVPLTYARSVAPHALELGPREPMTGRHEDRVTYPQFLRLPEGDLLFLYRDGRSGRGNLVLNRYTTRTRTWQQVHSNLIDGENQRSAYPAATIDRRGGLHLAWNWRDTPDVATNHDLCYAMSPDGGATWAASDGRPLTVPFTAANADYALPLPTGRSLMNPPSLTVDHERRPVLANYWAPEGSDVPQYHLVRYDGTSWRTVQVTNRTTPFTLAGTATKRPPLSRSVLLPHRVRGRPAEIHLVYRDDERDGRIVLASSTDVDAPSPTWKFRDLTTASVGAWEPSLDPEQALRLDQLHMLVQVVEQRDGDDRQAVSAPPSPIATLLWSPYAAGMLGSASTARPAAVTAAPDVPLDAGRVLEVLRRTATWQLAQPYRRDPRGWEIAPFYLGVLALAEASGEIGYREAIRGRAESMDWEPGARVYHADDHCVIQTYLRLHRTEGDPRLLAPSRRRLDAILAHPSPVTMEWDRPNATDRWTWCDALFMGPAAWLMMADATGERRHAEFAHREWWATTEALYRRDAGWYARDESFLDLREPNGERLFWSRGNGWVVAGLCHVLDLLPAEDPLRPRYLELYREMMRAALAAQQPDGLWRPGLLDPQAHPDRETSGSSFMTYALAYGVNRGLLPRAQVEPAIRRAWHALSGSVTPDGKLEHVQPIGAGPQGFDPQHNDWFGVGAFLLAGSEVFELAGGR